MVSLVKFDLGADLVEEGSSRKPNQEIKSETKQPSKLELTSKEKFQEKLWLWVNIGLFCLYITLAYSVFDALLNSTTSLITDIFLGNLTLIIMSATQIFSSVFLSYFVMNILGVKRTLALSMSMTTLFAVGFFYPVLPLLVVFSVLCGLFSTIMATAAYAYASNVGYWFQRLYNGNPEIILPLMNGLTTASMSGGFLWGNLILYFVLDNSSSKPSNSTFAPEFCGSKYCNEALDGLAAAIPQPSQEKVYILLGVFLAIGLLGTIGTIFLRDISRMHSKPVSPTKGVLQFFSILSEPYSILKEPKGFLPVIIIFFAGNEEVFTLNVLTQAYITCNAGVSKIGYIMFTYGVAQIMMATTQWLLLKLVHRIIVMTFVFAIFLGCYLYLLLAPQTFNFTTFFIITVLIGIGDANIVSTIFSIYGFLFEDKVESAVAIANLWWSLGCFLPFLWNQYLCVATKLYILIGLGSLACLLYFVLEFIIYKKSKKNYKM